MTDQPSNSQLETTWPAVPVMPTAMILVALALVSSGVFRRSIAATESTYTGQTWASVLKTIDPNHAPWWELSLLPRIGPTLAHAIVQHRDTAVIDRESDQRVFAQPGDLARVHGIGPRTVERLRPYLRFDQD